MSVPIGEVPVRVCMDICKILWYLKGTWEDGSSVKTVFGKVRGNRLQGFPPFVLNWKLIGSSKKKKNQTKKPAQQKQQQTPPKQQQKPQRTQLKPPGGYTGHTWFTRKL